MSGISLIFAFLAGGLLVAYASRRGWLALHRVQGCYVAIWNGASWRLRSGVAGDGGVLVDGVEYSYDVATPVEHEGLLLYIIAAEPLALADHERFERARVSVLKGALFRPGGDLVNWARVAALILPVVISVLIWMRLGDMQSTLTQVAVDAKTARQLAADVLARPLQLAPFDDR